MPQNKKTAEEFLQAAIQKYAISAPKLSSWLEKSLSEKFTVFDFPLENRKSILSTNSLELVNKEIRRKTRVVGVFPNETSYLRLISALFWRSEKSGGSVSIIVSVYHPIVKSTMDNSDLYLQK